MGPVQDHRPAIEEEQFCRVTVTVTNCDVNRGHYRSIAGSFVFNLMRKSEWYFRRPRAEKLLEPPPSELAGATCYGCQTTSTINCPAANCAYRILPRYFCEETLGNSSFQLLWYSSGKSKCMSKNPKSYSLLYKFMVYTNHFQFLVLVELCNFRLRSNSLDVNG